MAVTKATNVESTHTTNARPSIKPKKFNMEESFFLLDTLAFFLFFFIITFILLKAKIYIFINDGKKECQKGRINVKQQMRSAKYINPRAITRATNKASTPRSRCSTLFTDLGGCSKKQSVNQRRDYYSVLMIFFYGRIFSDA